jgi:hypothetical protein
MQDEFLGDQDVHVALQLSQLPKETQQEYWKALTPEQKNAVSQVQNAQSFLESSYRQCSEFLTTHTNLATRKEKNN